MKLYVPEIGDRIQLTKDWKFDLYHEYRNEGLLEALGKKFDRRNFYSERDKTDKITLEKKLILAVDRIYIRKGKGEYSSLSFKIEVPKELLKNEKIKTLDKKRFWAKLNQCNDIEFIAAKAKEPEIKSSKKKSETIKFQTSGYVTNVLSNIHKIVLSPSDADAVEKLKYSTFNIVPFKNGGIPTAAMNDMPYELPKKFLEHFQGHIPASLIYKDALREITFIVKYAYTVNDVEIETSSIFETNRSYNITLTGKYEIYANDVKIGEYERSSGLQSGARAYILKLRRAESQTGKKKGS